MGEHVFETVSSRLLHRGKIFALRSDDVLMPGGATATREVVEHYGAVAIVAISTKVMPSSQKSEFSPGA